MISELYKNLLGPKHGPFEVLDVNPLEEYITGILSPSEAGIKRDPELDAELPSVIPEEGVPEDDAQDELAVIHTIFLDPTAQPRSMGLSFSLTPEEGCAEMQICVTWARYVKTESGWRRKPRYHVTDPLRICTGQERKRIELFIDGDGRRCSSRDVAEVGLYVLSSPDPRRRGQISVSIFLVNELKSAHASSSQVQNGPRVEELHIFQPQIRVNILRGNLESVGGIGGKSSDREEEELSLIYGGRRVLARGHMCSAVWKDVDPERPWSPNPGEPPFIWTDAEIVDEETRKRFTNPDLRTEFIPVYSVETPSYDWNGSEMGPPPVLEAGRLAELWDPEEMRRALAPLADGYRRWIEGLEREAESMEGNRKEIAGRIIDRCRTVLNRICRGIDILVEDDDARLSFCFANKAMDIQRRWANRQRGVDEGLSWRPFQLAFVLLSLPSIVRRDSPERSICDILFVPTGAGKTEAYLFLAAFALAYRRRRAIRTGNPLAGDGVGVIMRYTLRLLTIQQFRRALSMITACEYLRVHGLREGRPAGWRPEKCEIKDDFIWGTSRFSIGLWVGGNVTPNRLGSGGKTDGALNILRLSRGNRRGRFEEGEPAQILKCPACGSILSVPDEGMPVNGEVTLHLLVGLEGGTARRIERALTRVIRSISAGGGPFRLDLAGVTDHGGGYATISLKFVGHGRITPDIVDPAWEEVRTRLKASGTEVRLLAARASRPGYFFRYAVRRKRGSVVPYDFDIYCPNPGCPLNTDAFWFEGHPHPANDLREIRSAGRVIRLPRGVFPREVPEFAAVRGERFLACRIPVPALTVDEQVYTRPPSFLVATVDKIARLAFEPRSGTLFGNVDEYHPYMGYFRSDLEPPTLSSLRKGAQAIPVDPFDPPDLIIQDELHLIEGPLGSMVGLYEAAVDMLCMKDGIPVKYVASSATIRGAEAQVRSVFSRRVLVFPPPGLTAEDRFFMRQRVAPHPLDEGGPGRAYVGVCAPGRGPLTPVVRIWSVLLQTVHDLAQEGQKDVDHFWTLVGYFNAIKELAGALSLYRQDIPEKLIRLGGSNARMLPEDNVVELSSRTKSTELPVILEELEKSFTGDVRNPGAVDALLTTSMFGTGVDIPRLSLMVVHGQPKTTSSYIQSTGRVGRRRAGLVVTFYRATRPRDMSHYELFCGYHMNLERFVEPVTASPFSEGALDRCCGPVCVAILRNMGHTQVRWHTDDSAMEIIEGIRNGEIRSMVDFLVRRAETQPPFRRPDTKELQWFISSRLERWRSVAQAVRRENGKLRYAEYGGVHNHVVLGDPQHQHARDIYVVFENAPQSLRDIEDTTSFET